VKRSGRDEPVWVVTHMCMETMLGISLYSYPYLKLVKTLYLSYYWYVFPSTKFQVLLGSEVGRKGQGAEGRDGSNNVCTYE
jgi:hypothetical protein